MDFSINDQKAFFNTGITRPYSFRIKQLIKLKQLIKQNEDYFILALAKDFNKPPFETYVSELQMVYDEIDYMLKNLRRMMKPERAKTPIMHFYSKSYTIQEPLGSVLIISPWNYPAALSLSPLVGAIAAGNCAVLKPSENSEYTTKLQKKIINENFDSNYICVIEGEAETTQALIAQGFDYCFFTGSSEVGKKIMESASEHLTPVTLELGGKSPTIVTEDADIAKAGCRIVWGKFLNAGQTCIAPDYVLVHESVKNKLILLIQNVLEQFYGEEVLYNEDYPSIINEGHFKRLTDLIDPSLILHGGEVNEEQLKISPTLLDNPPWDSKVMQEEIFGPLLPILTYRSLDEVITMLQEKPKPLALYLFTKSNDTKNKIVHHLSFGGGSINDTLIHFANSNLPFGGVGNSGMGSYHGKYSFDTFSHKKAISEKTNLFDLPMRYAPYKDSTLKFIQRFL